jgi:hypothetical protein
MGDDYVVGQQNALERINEEFNCWLYVHLVAAPVQIFGEVDGYHVDFHARGSAWSIEVGKDFDMHDSADVPRVDWTLPAEELMAQVNAQTKHPDAYKYSYVHGDELYAILHKCLTAFRAKQAAHGAANDGRGA